MSDTRYLGTQPPQINPKRRRVVLIGGGLASVAIVWYVVKRRNVTATDTTATTDTTSTDPNIDPTTGMPYGASSGDFSPPNLSSYVDPSTGATISGAGATPVITAPSTNAQWVQQAIAYLGQQGFDPISTSVALGKYISNKNLSDAELGIVQAALAAEGNPPVPPPAPHVAPPSGQTSTTSVTHSATQPGPPTGLRATVMRDHAVLSWNGVNGATGYRLHLNGVPVGRHTDKTSATVFRDGNWSVSSTRGTYTSKYSAPVAVKGIKR